MPSTAPALSPAPQPSTRSVETRSRRKTTTRKRRRPAVRRLKATSRFESLQPLPELLKARIIGQDGAVETLLSSFSRLLSGLRDPNRPLLTTLLLGPTGVGKTETARAVTHALFGADTAMTRVNCEEYAHGHEIAKLLGSPPGYVGHNIEPLLSQANVDAAHLQLRDGDSDEPTPSLLDFVASQNGDEPISVVLFDEIEKAHPTFWSALLGILDEGLLTLGNNTTTSFQRSIIFMTSNVGSREMGDLLNPRKLGFGTLSAPASGHGQLREVALEAARRHFPLEFLNRFDETLVYSSLDRDDLQGIFKKFLDEIHARTIHQANTPLLLKVSSAAADWIVERGTDALLGARPLRRAMEREIVDPLSRMIASRQLEAGDVVEIKREGDGLAFYRRRRQSQKIVA